MGIPQPFADAGHWAFEALRRGLRRGRPEESGGATSTREGESSDDDEFAGMLAELGCENDAADDADSRLRLAEQTIEELRHHLQELQPLGDQLAEVEQARLALLAELEAREDGPDARVERLEGLLAARDKELDRRERRIATLNRRLERMRQRFEERDRTASERWHELVELRRRLREGAEDGTGNSVPPRIP